mgnify:CR=1 FL=1
MLISFIEPDFTFTDDRGSLIQLVGTGYSQVNYISSKANVVRGGHYHKFNEEAFFVISGEFRLFVHDLEFKLKEEFLIKQGTFFVIPREVMHSFHFLEDTTLISMYSQGVVLEDGSKDIFCI